MQAQTGKKNSGDSSSFSVVIVDGFYAEAYSIVTELTDKNLKIIFRSDLEDEKDKTVFYKDLPLSDTLQQISKIDLHELKDYYTNPCVHDGSQVTIIFKKDNTKKVVHVSNFYQEEVGKVIYLINSLVPKKYKIWYDKEELIADYKRCTEEKK